MEFLKIWEVALRRKWLILGIFLVFTAIVIIETRLVYPVYRAKAKVLVKESDSFATLLSAMGLQVGGKGSSSSDSDSLDTDVALATIRPLLDEVINSLNLKRRNGKPTNPERLTEWTLLNTTMLPEPYLKAKQYEETDMVEISAYSADPVEAANMANKLAELYIKDRLKRTREEYNTARVFIEHQISRVKGSYYKSLADLKNFKIKEKSINLDLETQNMVSMVANLQTEQLKSLNEKVNDRLLSIAKKEVDFTREHPEYKQVEKELEIAEKLMQKETMPILNRGKILNDPVYDEFSKELIKLSEKSFQYSKLDLELSVNKDLYKNLLGYMDQVGIIESVTISDIKFVEPAVVDINNPSFPKKKLNYLLGAFLGLFWGMALAFFLEYIDNTIKLPEDLKNKSFNLLGAVPLSKDIKNNKLIYNMDMTSPEAEAFRAIKNNISLTSANKPIKTIVIGSAIEGEGSSSFASNIAISFCMEDKKIILADLNLRKPSLHKIFDVPNNKGITDVIADGLPLEEAIMPSKIKGLDLLLSGHIPFNPHKLLESPKLASMIGKLKERYNMVFIDTPPLLAVNDAFIIGVVAEGFIYLVETGRVAPSITEYVKTNLASFGVNLVGVVLNKYESYGVGYYPYTYYKRYLKR